MDLSGHFDETTRRIQVLALLVLRYRFNHRIGQALATEIIQRMFDELAAKTLPTILSLDCEIWNAALCGFTINQCGDVANHPSLRLSHKNSGGICLYVIVNVPCLAPAPIV